MQKHKQENAPREYTRDASPYFAFALEKLAVFLLKLSTRNRVHSPADSLGRYTPCAHALKGVLLNSASPDACEPSDRHLYHDRYVKDHVSEISSQNIAHYTPSPPQKQDGSETFTPRRGNSLAHHPVHRVTRHLMRTECRADPRASRATSPRSSRSSAHIAPLKARPCARGA